MLGDTCYTSEKSSHKTRSAMEKEFMCALTGVQYACHSGVLSHPVYISAIFTAIGIIALIHSKKV